MLRLQPVLSTVSGAVLLTGFLLGYPVTAEAADPSGFQNQVIAPFSPTDDQFVIRYRLNSEQQLEFSYNFLPYIQANDVNTGQKPGYPGGFTGIYDFNGIATHGSSFHGYAIPGLATEISVSADLESATFSRAYLHMVNPYQRRNNDSTSNRIPRGIMWHSLSLRKLHAPGTDPFGPASAKSYIKCVKTYIPAENLGGEVVPDGSAAACTTPEGQALMATVIAANPPLVPSPRVVIAIYSLNGGKNWTDPVTTDEQPLSADGANLKPDNFWTFPNDGAVRMVAMVEMPRNVRLDPRVWDGNISICAARNLVDKGTGTSKSPYLLWLMLRTRNQGLVSTAIRFGTDSKGAFQGYAFERNVEKPTGRFTALNTSWFVPVTQDQVLQPSFLDFDAAGKGTAALHTGPDGKARLRFLVSERRVRRDIELDENDPDYDPDSDYYDWYHYLTPGEKILAVVSKAPGNPTTGTLTSAPGTPGNEYLSRVNHYRLDHNGVFEDEVILRYTEYYHPREVDFPVYPYGTAIYLQDNLQSAGYAAGLSNTNNTKQGPAKVPVWRLLEGGTQGWGYSQREPMNWVSGDRAILLGIIEGPPPFENLNISLPTGAYDAVGGRWNFEPFAITTIAKEITSGKNLENAFTRSAYVKATASFEYEGLVFSGGLAVSGEANWSSGWSKTSSVATTETSTVELNGFGSFISDSAGNPVIDRKGIAVVLEFKTAGYRYTFQDVSGQTDPEAPTQIQVVMARPQTKSIVYDLPKITAPGNWKKLDPGDLESYVVSALELAQLSDLAAFPMTGNTNNAYKALFYRWDQGSKQTTTLSYVTAEAQTLQESLGAGFMASGFLETGGFKIEVEGGSRWEWNRSVTYNQSEKLDLSMKLDIPAAPNTEGACKAVEVYMFMLKENPEYGTTFLEQLKTNSWFDATTNMWMPRLGEDSRNSQLLNKLVPGSAPWKITYRIPEGKIDRIRKP